MRKLIICLCIILTIVSATGCKNDEIDYSKIIDYDNLNGLELPISNKNTKINIMCESAVTDREDDTILEVLKKITGLDINLTTVKVANMEQALQSRIASKRLPDIFYFYLDDQTRQSLAMNKSIVSIDENINLMPNYKKLAFDDPQNYNMLKSSIMSDGHLYQLNSYIDSRNVNHCFMYRKDIFDKNNIKPWTNTEEFYENLKKLKEIYPDCTPFSTKLKDVLFNYFNPQWGISGSYAYDDTEKCWKYAKTSSNMKDMMSFAAKLYNEGLLDKDFLTITPSGWMTKMTNDESFVTLDWVDRADIISESMKETNKDYDLRIGYPIGTHQKYLSKTKFATGTTYAVANNSNYESSLKLMDFLFSEEGSKLTTLGIEGVTFKYGKTPNDFVEYIGFENKKSLNITELEKKHGLFISALALRFDKRCAYYNYSERTKEAQDFVEKNNFISEDILYLDISPINIAAFEECKYKLDLAFEKYFTRFFSESENFEAVWNEWINEAENLNVSFVNKIISESSVSYY